MITLATPNQGAALANWFYSSEGNSLGILLGMINPGEQSLETPNVQFLRGVWDQIFTVAKIPFYTLSGKSYQCAPDAGACTTQITGPILCSITGGTNTSCKGAPANDGLVTHLESLLPSTYSTELAVLNTNNDGMALGANTFPFIFKVVKGLP